MRALPLVILLALAPAAAQRSTPTRADLAAAEESLYHKLVQFHVEAPVDVLGLPRGIYLDGYGAVFTVELNVIQTPGLSPFRPALTRDDLLRIRAAKEKRLPEIRTLMRQMLAAAAASLARLPGEEQVVVGLVLFHNKWEDSTALPRMITMQAQKKALLEVAANRAPPASLDAAIQVREE